MSSGNLCEQRLGFLQVTRREPLSKPIVTFNQYGSGVGDTALFLIVTRQAHRSPQFQRLGLLLPGDGVGSEKTAFRLAARTFAPFLTQQELALEAVQFRRVETFACTLHQGSGFRQCSQTFLGLSFPAEGF